MNRRDFLQILGGAAAGAGGLAGWQYFRAKASATPAAVSLTVNDIHSKLNSTTVKAIEAPQSLEDLLGIVRRAKREKDTVCIAGARHAMGGQQFAKGGVLLDTRGMKSVMDLDTKRGLVQVECGIEWPDLVAELQARQANEPEYWTIRCKQTGADKLTMGGAIAANAHGRTLTHPPMIEDIEDLLLVNSDGASVTCDRNAQPELFKLTHGGYGMTALVHSATYRLEKRHKLRREVEVVTADNVMAAFDKRLADGYTHGDWQYNIDETSEDYLNRGVFSCYKPVPFDSPIPEEQVTVSDRQWQELVYLAHNDQARAYKLYEEFYLKSSGQIYWSDTSQLGGYNEDYHVDTDKRLGAKVPATEMITEISVPRDRLADFLAEAATNLRKLKASVIYGTVRLIKEDKESFLRWAKGDFACTIFNLHVEHSEEKIRQAADAFRMLIDLSVARGGTYYLTYHRWARKDQVLACYPEFPEFLARKAAIDPDGFFRSSWHAHYREMFGV